MEKVRKQIVGTVVSDKNDKTIVVKVETRKKHPQINTLIKILEPFGYTLSITKIKEEKDESR